MVHLQYYAKNSYKGWWVVVGKNAIDEISRPKYVSHYPALQLGWDVCQFLFLLFLFLRCLRRAFTLWSRCAFCFCFSLSYSLSILDDSVEVRRISSSSSIWCQVTIKAVSTAVPHPHVRGLQYLFSLLRLLLSIPMNCERTTDI